MLVEWNESAENDRATYIYAQYRLHKTMHEKKAKEKNNYDALVAINTFDLPLSFYDS